MKERAALKRRARAKPQQQPDVNEKSASDLEREMFAGEREELERKGDPDWSPHEFPERRHLNLEVSRFGRPRRSESLEIRDVEKTGERDSSPDERRVVSLQVTLTEEFYSPLERRAGTL